MTWVKIDDRLPQHPKFMAVSAEARWVYIAGLCHAAAYLTDGYLAEQSLAAVTAGTPRPKKLAGELIAAGLWEPIEGGYRVHDYLDYQPAAADVLKRRAEDLKRKKGGEAAHSARIPDGNSADSARIPAVPSLPRPDPVPTPSVVPTLVVNPEVECAAETRAAAADAPPRTRSVKSASLPIDEAFIAELAVEFAPRLGSEARVRRSIDRALNHKAFDQAKDKRKRLRSWLEEDLDRMGVGVGPVSVQRHTDLGAAPDGLPPELC